MQAALAKLRATLAEQATDYHCLTPLGGDRVRVNFIGCFDGSEVIWKAELIAMGRDTGAAQFLDIAAAEADGIPIQIGLAVACIDQPTLLKTIIMVRNYKRLRCGRHEFGPQGPVATARRQSPQGSSAK